jgi:hypothetical protein
VQLVTSVQWLNDMFNGVALLAAVSFAVWRQRRRKAALDAPPPAVGQEEKLDRASTGEPDGGPVDRAQAAVRQR